MNKWSSELPKESGVYWMKYKDDKYNEFAQPIDWQADIGFAGTLGSDIMLGVYKEHEDFKDALFSTEQIRCDVKDI